MRALAWAAVGRPHGAMESPFLPSRVPARSARRNGGPEPSARGKKDRGRRDAAANKQTDAAAAAAAAEAAAAPTQRRLRRFVRTGVGFGRAVERRWCEGITPKKAKPKQRRGAIVVVVGDSGGRQTAAATTATTVADTGDTRPVAAAAALFARLSQRSGTYTQAHTHTHTQTAQASR